MQCLRCNRSGHQDDNCLQKPLKRVKNRKPLKQAGKVRQGLTKANDEWREQNKPNHQGYYTCYLCGHLVHESEVNIEHIKSKTRSPGTRFDQSNLAPAHSACNEAKGSMSLDEYLLKSSMNPSIHKLA